MIRRYYVRAGIAWNILFTLVSEQPKGLADQIADQLKQAHYDRRRIIESIFCSHKKRTEPNRFRSQRLIVTTRNYNLDYAFEWEETVDEFQMQACDAVRSDALTANYRYYLDPVAFADDADKGAGIQIPLRENCCTAETDILSYGRLAFYYITVLVQDLEGQCFRNKEASLFS